ncbi:hypothetical protein AC249_AIPGENE12431 [Exaiptasia diaphana]|nr:hypothetical protein AC249_AIPGENE12431 [Exaiptasia diaphana]
MFCVFILERPTTGALTVEQRLRRLQGQSKDSVTSASQSLHRTLDKTNVDFEDAILDLEALVKCAKLNNHARAREFECALDEIQKHSKTLPSSDLNDLITALVGDPVKSKVLEKATKFLKHSSGKSERVERRCPQSSSSGSGYNSYSTLRSRERYAGRNQQP